jgi:hypothetical protein
MMAKKSRSESTSIFTAAAPCAFIRLYDDGRTSPYHKAEPSRTELNEQEWNGMFRGASTAIHRLTVY